MKHLSLYIDIAFCLVVLPIMIFLFPVERWFHYVPWYVVSVGCWLYITYIFNRIVTVPLFFKPNKLWILGLCIIVVSIIITYALASVIWYVPRPNDYDQGIVRLFPSVTQHRQAVWSLFVIVETFSFAVGLLSQANFQRSRRLQLEAERERAQNELYKAQVRPHFMFNTLNSLYGLFLTGNERALESLEKYISMIRYIHNSSSKNVIPLSSEADYIRQFVDLQSLRLNDKTTVNLRIDVESPELMIPPMLLVTFVENCFKHGVSPVVESEIIISLTESDGKLIFMTSNHVFPRKRIGEHIGIENCRKRLNLLYPNCHQLIINNDNSTYDVKLIIELKEK